jgi:hypothetical protein
MMLTAGVGWVKLEPAAAPIASTKMTAISPTARPRTIAAGAIHIRQSGTSSARPTGRPPDVGGAGGTGAGGGMLLIVEGRLGARELSERCDPAHPRRRLAPIA